MIGGYGALGSGDAVAADFEDDAIYVARSGGEEVTIPSAPSGVYKVHAGPNGDATDPVLYSGVEGQGAKITTDNGIAVGIVPPLPVGGPYSFFFERISGQGPVSALSDPILYVLPDTMRSRTLSIRRLFPTRIAVGAARTELVDFPQE